MATKKIDLKVLAVEYAEIIAQESLLETKKEEIKAKIKLGMIEAGADRIETNQGIFSTYITKRWKYSPAVKALQETEQEKGIAEMSETEVFKFTPVKVKVV